MEENSTRNLSNEDECVVTYRVLSLRVFDKNFPEKSCHVRAGEMSDISMDNLKKKNSPMLCCAGECCRGC